MKLLVFACSNWKLGNTNYDETTKKKQTAFITPFPAVKLTHAFQRDPVMLQYHIGNESEIQKF